MADIAASRGAKLFTPKLADVLREGYGGAQLRADAMAGLTVAIVALPLSMAIAIASGVSPDRGLYTAIVGGFLVSALGGSRFQIGGPAGAFIVLIAATVHQHGVEGLVLATFLSGLMIATVGALRLGAFIQYIPYPVTVGFTAGIAVIILASQIKDLLGLRLAGPEPGPLPAKLGALAQALPTVSLPAVLVAGGVIATILAVRRWRPHWPGMLIAVTLAAAGAALLDLSVETIATRFGGIPRGLPLPGLPEITLAKVQAVLPAALSFTLLGSIESLLSAVVADSMTGRRHRSNMELVAQGAANVGASMFGGIPVTGTIARTATNVRSGSAGPISGILHSLYLLVFMIVAAPLAGYIPLAALAGVLAVVAWTMAEKQEFAGLLRASRGDAAVLLLTFFLTIFRDLTTGIVAGFSVGALLFLHRLATAVEVGRAASQGRDEDDGYDAALTHDPDVALIRISGAFFFGAAAAVGTALDEIGEQPKAYVLDLTDAPILDSTAAAAVANFARRAKGRGAFVYLAGARKAVVRTLLANGVRPPLARFKAEVAQAVISARRSIAEGRLVA
ncbi:SulP family inorganic anion transporter [Phenylobacterium sp.]|uniref:SulP family inorganic anion transporter n=1 Tax=Phenylobacterium sp. TaxID=1871053 RepID=UPI002FC9B334